MLRSAQSDHLHDEDYELSNDVSEHHFGGRHSGDPASIQKSFLPLDDEGQGGEADGHEVGDGQDDPRSHELGEGGVVGSVHRLLEHHGQRSLGVGT